MKVQGRSQILYPRSSYEEGFLFYCFLECISIVLSSLTFYYLKEYETKFRLDLRDLIRAVDEISEV